MFITLPHCDDKRTIDIVVYDALRETKERVDAGLDVAIMPLTTNSI